MRYNPINKCIMAVQSMLEAMEGMLYLLVLRRDCAQSTKVPEVMRFVLLCMLEVFGALEVMEVMRCVPLCIWRPWRVGSVCWTCRM